MRRESKSRTGSVVKDRRSQIWQFFWWADGKRHSKTLGRFPSKTAAWNASQQFRVQPSQSSSAPTVATLIKQYTAEKMPRRASTRRGYDIWLRLYILPQWGNAPITEVTARPIELWLQSLEVAPKSRAHIRGMLRILWEYSMWAGHVPVQRNPMELVSIPGASQRQKVPRSLTTEEFQKLLAAFDDNLRWRTFFLLAISFGLRISEVLGLKWKDVDWLGKTVSINRGVVKAIVDDVKSRHSARKMACADELLDILKTWKQTTQFADAEDWVFASPVKLCRMPLGYTSVWNVLTTTSTRLGIAHVSSHCFRHTYRSWLDALGSPIGVQQRMMRHSSITTTANYGDTVPADLRQAHEKVVHRALRHGNGTEGSATH
jgi:integrase